MASGGYTVKLPASGTPVPESYYCPHCKLILRSAVQTSDGDRLCEPCFKTIVEYGLLACIRDMNFASIVRNFF